ncbi:MAG TPA: serine acetyltransferase [Polyangia bacterium]|nr:serine acetyltransferase [Polyangia bacterium]
MLTTSNPLPFSADAPDDALSQIADGICAASQQLFAGRQRQRPLWPSRAAVAALVQDLRAVLFPGHFGGPDLAPESVRDYVTARLERIRPALREQIRRSLSIACEHAEATGAGACPGCEARAVEATDALLARLPAIRRLLDSDLRAAFASDPAATFLDETLYCQPGVVAIAQHRIAHQLHLLSIPLLPRIIATLAHAETGVDIHPGAEIGPHFFIDHGTGVVIGETAQIGARVRVHQGVTIGARGFSEDPYGFLVRDGARRPVIGDDVVIHAGASVLGPVTIGVGAVIGGNVWLTQDVPAGAHVTQGRPQYDVFEDGGGI